MVFLILKVLSQEGKDHQDIIDKYREQQANKKVQNEEVHGREAQRRLKEEVLEDFRRKETS